MMQPIPHLAFMPHVNGLRAIAVLSVIVYHLNSHWLPGGFLGVDIFFVISGFIVSASVGALDRVSLIKFMGLFYARRFQRIAPALVVCLLITCVATTLLVPSAWLSEGNQRTARAAFFGLSNFVLAKTSNDYFSPFTDFNPYTHTWSLGVEEQFYFVFPLLFFAWNFHATGRRWAVGLFVAALIASASYAAWITQSDKTLAFYMLTSRFWELAAGVLLFQVMTLCGRRFDIQVQTGQRAFGFAATASLALIIAGFAVVPESRAFPFPGALPAVVGALGMLGFMHGMRRDHVLMRLLANRPAQFIGKISYSLYLWHWPVFVLFRWTVGLDAPQYRVAAVTLAFVLATASYYWVESPLRRHRILRHKPS
ncbi:MAG: acyltransferase, partial [Herminiimonas sp.]|nr:acyltransferase [Herminiimonas sp.]